MTQPNNIIRFPTERTRAHMERISRAEDWIEEIWKIALTEGVPDYEADVTLSWMENDIPVTADFD